MRIINIVDSLSKVNYGIWNSVVSTADILRREYGVDSELWYPRSNEALPSEEDINGCFLREIGTFNPKDVITEDSILISHGCWQLPTRMAYNLHNKFGVKWMYVPHGMLEPNSLKQKYWFKKLYFMLFEKRMTLNAASVRAVSLPEKERLEKHYTNVVHIANGVSEDAVSNANKKEGQYLFMARLHKQKGVCELVKAWKASDLCSTGVHSLVIVGPDDGELELVQQEIKDVSSISYVGSKYGDEKKQTLAESQFYILPSKAEGFPTSVVEAMQFGLIPIITDYCNFPESIIANIAIRTNTNVDAIVSTLNETKNMDKIEIETRGHKANIFIKNNYLLSQIASKQYKVYSSLLP